MKKKIISIGLICTLALSFAGCGKKEDKKIPETTATNVKVSAVQKGDIGKTISYTGEIKSTSTASVSAKVSANIEKIHVEVGDYVKAGDVLMTLDSTQYRLAYNQALAAKSSAEASKKSAQAAKRSAEASKNQAEASKKQALAAMTSAEAAKSGAEAAKSGAEASYNNVSGGSLEQSKVSMNQAVANAQSAYDSALDNYNRQKALYDIGAISKVALDSAETSLNSAKIALNAAKANAELNENVVIPQTEAGANAGVSQADAGVAQATAGINQAEAGITQAEAGITQATAGITQAEAGITQAEAGIKQSEVALDIAKTNLANCTIVAPISGYITSKNASIGQMASPGIEIFSIKNAEMLDAELSVTESVISSVEEGALALVSVKSAHLNDIKGKISLVGKAKNDATGMYTVKVAIPNDDGKIKIGMIADVSLPTESVQNVLTVDFDALTLKNGKYFVYVADGDKAVKKDVEIGITDGNKAEVKSGLKVGDKVVTDGKDFLSEKNNKIKIIK